jgi:hypothetical protein
VPYTLFVLIVTDLLCIIPNMSSDVQGNSDQVILVTGGYDHTIKMWQAHTGVCQRTAQHTDSVSLTLTVSALQMPYPYWDSIFL